MVKRPKIAPNPVTADVWVNDAGIDAELQNNQAESTPTEKPYPHRVSFDTTKVQYRHLKRASFELDKSMNEIIREAVQEWLDKKMDAQ